MTYSDSRMGTTIPATECVCDASLHLQANVARRSAPRIVKFLTRDAFQMSVCLAALNPEEQCSFLTSIAQDSSPSARAKLLRIVVACVRQADQSGRLLDLVRELASASQVS
jgi:hypothetical protein